jgi:acyl-CoA reductase-like NAD-dependent aldehyde dehydrogenase
MTELSPAAQAVLDAAFDPWQSTDTPASIVAAALRAAADQLQERKPRLNIGIDWSCSELYAIAAELEAQ